MWDYLSSTAKIADGDDSCCVKRRLESSESRLELYLSAMVGSQSVFRREPPSRDLAPLVARFLLYRGTSLIRKRPTPRTTIGSKAYSYCRALEGALFLMSEVPL